jgi:hypothetical protein
MLWMRGVLTRIRLLDLRVDMGFAFLSWIGHFFNFFEITDFFLSDSRMIPEFFRWSRRTPYLSPLKD